MKKSIIFVFVLLMLLVLSFSSFVFADTNNIDITKTPLLYGSTWQFKSDIVSELPYSYSFPFSSNGESFNEISMTAYSGFYTLAYVPNRNVWNASNRGTDSLGTWTNDNYRTITFSSDYSKYSTHYSTDFVSFLNSHATFKAVGALNKPGSYQFNSTFNLPFHLSNPAYYNGGRIYYGTDNFYVSDFVIRNGGCEFLSNDGTWSIEYTGGKWLIHKGSTSAAYTEEIAPPTFYYYATDNSIANCNLYHILNMNASYIGSNAGGGSSNPGGSTGTPISPNPPQNADIVDWLKYIVELIEYPFVLLFSYLTHVFNIVSGFVSSLFSLISWIPSDILTCIWCLVLVSIVIGIIKIFRG